MKRWTIICAWLLWSVGCGTDSSSSLDPAGTSGATRGQSKLPASNPGGTPRTSSHPRQQPTRNQGPRPIGEPRTGDPRTSTADEPQQPKSSEDGTPEQPKTGENGLPVLVNDGGARCRVREICRYPRLGDAIALTSEWIVDDAGRVLIESRKPGMTPGLAGDSVRNEYAYGPNGALIWRRISTDTNLDGVYERSETQWYDANGRVIRRELDRDNDGIADEVETREWDVAGRLFRSILDVKGDGSLIQRFEADYLDSGIAKQKRWYQNDTLTGSETNFLDTAGRVIRRERDDDGDGKPDHLTLMTITDLPTAELVATDWTGDGTIDRIERLTRDVQGRVVLQELDLDANGSFDSQISTLYQDGKRIEETRTLSATGLVQSITRRVYDAQNRLLLVAADWNADGIDDSTTSYTFHPTLGTITEIALREGDLLQSREWWSYRDDGQLLAHVQQDASGTRRYDEQLTYFSNGWPASRTRKVVDLKYEDSKIDRMSCSYQYTSSCEPLASVQIPKLPKL